MTRADGGGAAVLPSGGPLDPYVRYDAKVLDRATATRFADGPAPHTTSYVQNRLMVTAAGLTDAREIVAALADVANTSGGLQVTRNPLELINADGQAPRRQDGETDLARLARLLAAAAAAGLPLVFPVELAYADKQQGPRPPVDAWPVLLNLRSRNDARIDGAFGLDHLMIASADIVGNPFPMRGQSMITGDPFPMRGQGAGVQSYAQPGYGGHGPISVVLAPPAGRSGAPTPGVVVLDTGIGAHQWFAGQPVIDELRLSSGDPIGTDIADPGAIASNPEGLGAVPDPMTGLLGTHSGHGTFISGLLRQSCPEATIYSLRVMGADGTVPESDLTAAVTGLGTVLVERPNLFQAVVLSLGYYAESGVDLTYTAGLEVLLVALSDAGVVTFAAAGNDSSQVPMYPAAFAAHSTLDGSSRLPLIAVAALNPDGTVALFSNDGTWVRGEAPGANLVSTVPQDEQGGGRADTEFVGPGGPVRATIDPDNFSSGFATWSGTSFAAPVLAGRYLATLVGHADLVGTPGSAPDTKTIAGRASEVPTGRTGQPA